MKDQSGVPASLTPGQPLPRREWMKTTLSIAGGGAAARLLGVGDASAAAAAASPPTSSAAASTAPAAAGVARAAAEGPRVILSAPAAKNVVEITSGKVRGFVRNGIFTFKGMPYAASTAGHARFMAPAKPTPWAGVRSSMALGFACPQAFHVPEGRRGGWAHDEEAFMFEWDDGQPGEDCLSVNVWTPSLADAGKRPVLVWIHGGGYSSGSANELRMYDGESLARRGDVVVVSLNHRLGALGYLNLQDYGEKWSDAVNVGQLDIIAALAWVRDNIARFGGDPSRVLTFGQSGGGAKIGTLMGMPAAKGLFHRAVIQSGSGLRQIEPDRSASLAAAVLAELGVTRATIDRLQEVPADTIVQAGIRARQKMQPAAGATPGPGGAVNWGPSVDGRSIPRHTWSPAASELSAGVPLLVGSVLNEFANSVQAGDPTLDTMTAEEMRKRIGAQRGARADEIVSLFQKQFPHATPYEIVSRVAGMGPRMNVIAQATLKAEQRGAPVFVYWFQWQTPILDGRPRAYHCSELPFVFANVDRCAAMTGGGAEAHALADKMADAWIAFARNGDPHHTGLPAWPAFSPDKGQTMIFDNTCRLENDPDKQERTALHT
jgi:para-nitrobenzyl esterase